MAFKLIILIGMAMNRNRCIPRQMNGFSFHSIPQQSSLHRSQVQIIAASAEIMLHANKTL